MRNSDTRLFQVGEIRVKLTLLDYFTISMVIGFLVGKLA
jgi:hypothetical protein